MDSPLATTMTEQAVAALDSNDCMIRPYRKMLPQTPLQ